MIYENNNNVYTIRSEGVYTWYNIYYIIHTLMCIHVYLYRIYYYTPMCIYVYLYNILCA